MKKQIVVWVLILIVISAMSTLGYAQQKKDKARYEKDYIRCFHQDRDVDKITTEYLRPLFRSEEIKGPKLNKKYTDLIWGAYSTTRLYLITVVHVVARPSPQGGFAPIVSDEYIEAVFQVANDIWSQACIELVPYTGALVTEWVDISLSAFAGLCLNPSQFEMVEPYDINAPGVKIVNIYLVEDTNGIACGSPVSGRIFLPTTNALVNTNTAGRVLAHELGHVLLNPVGVSDSANPDHLMFHKEQHPETTPGSQDALFLSDCVGARTTAKEDLFSFGRPGGLGNPQEPVACQLSPRLGNNLAIIATEVATE